MVVELAPPPPSPIFLYGPEYAQENICVGVYF